jgi:hypothetical protein
MNCRIFICVLGLLAGLLAGCKKGEAAGADPKRAVEISLGSQSKGNGVQLMVSGDGRTVVENVGGSACRSCRSGKGGHAYIYFAIDPKIKGPEMKNGKVVVEYFDSGPGELRMQYDGSKTGDDGHGAYSGSGVVEKMTGSLVWKTAAFPFRDAVFKNRQNGRADLRVEAMKADLSVRKVTVVREEGK